MTEVVQTIREVRERIRAAWHREARVALVPTMGSLHEGHVSLVRAARAEAHYVVVSVFVNPAQFASGEDYDIYPRRLDNDRQVCDREKVDLVFAPPADEMYPAGTITRVHVPDMSERLCGRFRPGHFDGVCTVVAKLLNIVQPDLVYFGEKDAQQLAIVRRMVTDLNLPVEVRACPLIRAPDGLAVSSRNEYLAENERVRALALSRALDEARRVLAGGERRADQVASLVRREILGADDVDLEYAEVVDPDTLQPLKRVKDRVLVAVAARVGRTRLIDNLLLRDL